jgi:opacity protein-like surface antigen
MLRTVGLIVVFALAVAAPAAAQDSPFSVNLGAGFTIPNNELKDSFGTGGNFQFGVNFRVSPMFKIQAEYDYHRLASKDISGSGATPKPGIISDIELDANHTMHGGLFNLVIGPPQGDKIAVPYGIGGIGVFHRIVNITTPAIGLATVCDPWLYICYPTPVEVDQIIGERSHTDFGFNVGGGVSFRMGDTARFYAEVRYIHTNGPTINDATGASRTADGNYFPVTFGFRFLGN